VGLEGNGYLERVLEEKRGCRGKCLELQGDFVEGGREREKVREKARGKDVVTVRIERNDWKSLFDMVLYMHEVVGSRERDGGVVSEKLLKSKFRKNLSNVDFDLFTTQILLDVDPSFEAEIMASFENPPAEDQNQTTVFQQEIGPDQDIPTEPQPDPTRPDNSQQQLAPPFTKKASQDLAPEPPLETCLSTDPPTHPNPRPTLDVEIPISDL
jgi:hypothetical protein